MTETTIRTQTPRPKGGVLSLKAREVKIISEALVRYGDWILEEHTEEDADDLETVAAIQQKLGRLA